MRFRFYDSLKIFDTVVRSLSMTKAADEVHQSKGSISYQVGKLEASDFACLSVRTLHWN
jgi:LysR family glycine cleavage system transcriptional activator